MHFFLPEIDFGGSLRHRADVTEKMAIFFRCLESGKRMRLLDGYEDFRVRTLARIPGCLAKALFMRKCRGSGGYSHWGMLNAYGEVQGCKILRHIDREIHIEVLRRPIDELLNEMQVNAETLDTSSLSASESSDIAVLGTAGFEAFALRLRDLGLYGRLRKSTRIAIPTTRPMISASRPLRATLVDCWDSGCASISKSLPDNSHQQQRKESRSSTK